MIDSTHKTNRYVYVTYVKLILFNKKQQCKIELEEPMIKFKETN